MDRLDWMCVRALVPPGLVLAFTAVLSWLLKDLSASLPFADLAGLPRWVFLGGVVIAAALTIEPLYRFWKWKRGEGLICPSCGGPLGDLIDGRYGPYYKCLCCRGNVAAHRVE